MIVTRFAPSPTGKPHVGNIRTAVFSYLWAKHNKGKFLLRIEDTDRARFVPEAVKYIEEALSWLGISYDDEMVYQSERKEVHKEYAEKLVKEGKAYKCFCTKERLEKLRGEQEKNKRPPGYDGKCRNLSNSELDKLEKERKSYVIRFKMPDTGKAVWDDGIRGKMEIDYAVSDDQVILKADGYPTYHLASIVDDHEAGVTDVIRGEEWISSTPKHVAIHKALGFRHPKYSHMPHIIGPDKKKLSKRHGDTAIMDYRDKGYLPESMLNFLALLGWNDGTEKELFSHDELVASFDLVRVGKAPAVFDLSKLNWLNGQYIRETNTKKLKKEIETLYPKADIVKLDNFERILEVEKSRLATLEDITKDTDYFVKLPKYESKLLVFKKSTKENTKKGLRAAYEKLSSEKWEDDVEKLSNILAVVVEDTGLSNGDIFWPVRVALSGKENSPSPAELLWVFGKDESLRRLRKALRKF
ncbi:MAG: glutamate--tRNA ligase [Patescibacteria group bacterium]|nr:glutamate--tRNA ligase [Patescibacteria group bacterium]